MRAMRNATQLLGLVLALQGISGAIDHLAVQPFFSLFLNLFNRVVIPRVDFLSGYELLANLTLAALGLALVLLSDRPQPS
jgi:hypothetical protein